MKEYESFERCGVEPHRSYYIPFAEDYKLKYKFGIVDRNKSSRFLSLDGVWQIKQHNSLEEIVLNEELTETIPVPACVQMHGYDQIQYLNTRYPFPVILPHITNENPCWHYRRKFILNKKENQNCRLVIFFLYVQAQACCLF